MDANCAVAFRNTVETLQMSSVWASVATPPALEKTVCYNCAASTALCSPAMIEASRRTYLRNPKSCLPRPPAPPPSAVPEHPHNLSGNDPNAYVPDSDNGSRHKGFLTSSTFEIQTESFATHHVVVFISWFSSFAEKQMSILCSPFSVMATRTAMIETWQSKTMTHMKRKAR